MAAGCLLAACSRNDEKRDSETPKTVVRETIAKPRQSSSKPRDSKQAAASPKPAIADEFSTEQKLLITGRVMLKGGGPATSAVLTLGRIELTNYYTTTNPEETSACSVLVDMKGNYAITAPDELSYILHADAPGAAGQQRIIVDPRYNAKEKVGTRRTNVDFSLEPASYIRGHVVDENSNALANVSVRALANTPEYSKNQHDGAATTTTADGHFALEQLNAGHVTIVARDSAHAPVSIKADAPSDNLEIRLDSTGATVRGTVSMSGTQEPVTSAGVTLVPGTGRNGERSDFQPVRCVTDQGGTFLAEHLPPGPYQLHAAADGIGLLPLSNPDAYRLKLDAKETTEVALLMYGGHTITGFVSEKDTSAPMAEAKVWWIKGAWPQDPKAQAKGVLSAKDGSFEVKHVFSPTGEQVSLDALLPGYSMVTKRNSGLTLDMANLRLSRDIELQHNASVSGIIKTEDGVPVAGAAVSSFGGFGLSNDVEPDFGPDMVRSDKEGKYTILVPPGRAVRMKAKAPSYPLCFSEELKPNDQPTTGVDVILTIAGPISGRVTDETGKPVNGCDIKVSYSLKLGTSEWSALLDRPVQNEEGRFASKAVPAGSFIVVASREGYARSKQEKFDLKSKESRDLTLILRSGHYIAGRVLDQQGKPVVNANVYAQNRSNTREDLYTGSATTDDTGRYMLKDLLDTIYTVNANHHDYKEAQARENVHVDQDNIDIVLGGKAEDSKFTVHLVDATSGQPVADYKVVSLNEAKVQKNAGQQGTFVVSGLPSWIRQYSLHVEAPNYAPMNISTTWEEWGDRLERTIKMSGGGTVRGRVVRKGDSSPVAGAKLRVNDSAGAEPLGAAVSGADGSFQISGVYAGRKTVAAEPTAPLKPGSKACYVTAGEVNDVGDIQVGAGGALVVHVVRSADDSPMPDVAINVERNNSTEKFARTDAAGIMRAEDLEGGSYSVRAAAYNISNYATVTNEETHDVTLRIGSGTIRGKVMKDGAPIGSTGNYVYARGPYTYNATLKDEGAFEMKNLPPGTYTLTAYYSDSGAYRVIEKEVVLGENETQEVVLDFGSTAHLVGKVVNSSDQPVAGASLLLTKPDAKPEERNTTQNATSKQDGTFAFYAAGGKYHLVARKPGEGTSELMDVEVPQSGDSAPVTIRIKSSEGTLVSTVLDEMDGKPLPLASLSITSQELGSARNPSERGPDGVQTVTGIAPGKYKVRVALTGYTSGEHEVEIKANETVRVDDVLAPAGSLYWTLLDNRGTPLAKVVAKLTANDPSSLQAPVEKTTSNDGSASFDGVLPGAYTISCQPAGFAAVAVPITITVAGTQRITTRAATIP